MSVHESSFKLKTKVDAILKVFYSTQSKGIQFNFICKKKDSIKTDTTMGTEF